jgi:hypothetical protein
MRAKGHRISPKGVTGVLTSAGAGKRQRRNNAPLVAFNGTTLRLPTTVRMSLRSAVSALPFILAGATIFIFGCLCAIYFLVDRDCGPAWGYYGCKAPAHY